MTSVTLQDVQDAARRIAGAVHHTPVLRSRTLDELTPAFFRSLRSPLPDA